MTNNSRSSASKPTVKVCLARLDQFRTGHANAWEKISRKVFETGLYPHQLTGVVSLSKLRRIIAYDPSVVSALSPEDKIAEVSLL